MIPEGHRIGSVSFDISERQSITTLTTTRSVLVVRSRTTSQRNSGGVTPTVDPDSTLQHRPYEQ